MITLAFIRHQLSVRLGFAATGQAAARQNEIMAGFVNSAIDLVNSQVTDETFYASSVLSLGLGQALIDLPDDFNPEKPFAVFLRNTANNGRWVRLAREKLFLAAQEMGETPFEMATTGMVGDPLYYRLAGNQIDISPVPESALYQLRVDYCRVIRHVVNGVDTVAIKPEAVFHVALGLAKAHYQQPDAALYNDIGRLLTLAARGAGHVDKRYIPGGG